MNRKLFNLLFFRLSVDGELFENNGETECCLVLSSETWKRPSWLMSVFLDVNAQHNENGNQPVWGGDVDGTLQTITSRIGYMSRAPIVVWHKLFWAEKWNPSLNDEKLTGHSANTCQEHCQYKCLKGAANISGATDIHWYRPVSLKKQNFEC